MLPSIPAVPSSHDQPSPLYQLVLDNLENPPILKRASWTRAAPFKEERHARSPSESIANNFTPTAANLKLRALRRRRTRSSRKEGKEREGRVFNVHVHGTYISVHGNFQYMYCTCVMWKLLHNEFKREASKS